MAISKNILSLALICLLQGNLTSGQAVQDGYSCDGSIIQKDHSANDFSAANYICCEGDPNSGVFGNVGPTSCTAGTAVPLTERPKAGGGGGATKTSSNGGGGGGAATTSINVGGGGGTTTASLSINVGGTELTTATTVGGSPAQASTNFAAPTLGAGDMWIGAVVAAGALLV
jgi:hypothetical protein